MGAFLSVMCRLYIYIYFTCTIIRYRILTCTSVCEQVFPGGIYKTQTEQDTQDLNVCVMLTSLR